MKNSLKWVGTAMVLALLGCTTGESQSPDDSNSNVGFQKGVSAQSTPAIDLTGTSWRLVTFNGAAAVGIAEQVEGGTRQRVGTLEFAKGNAGGNSGCNDFGGLYLQDGDVLQFGSIIATEMGCNEPVATQEANLFSMFSETVRFDLSENRLSLASDSHKAIYERAEICRSCEYLKPASGKLIGPNWRIRLVNRDYVSGFYKQPKDAAYLRFRNGTVSFSMGCNLYNAPLTISVNRIEAGPFTATKKACSGETGKLEPQVAAILAGDPVVTFGHNHDVLIGGKAGKLTAEIFPLPQDK